MLLDSNFRETNKEGSKEEKTEKCCVLQIQLGGVSIGSQKGKD